MKLYLSKGKLQLYTASSYLYITTNQNHAFVYVHFDTYKYTQYVLKLYKPDEEGSNFLGGEWNWVGIKWYFVVSLLFDYFYLLDFIILLLLDGDGMHKYVICATHHLCSLKHNLHI